jgi:glycosyltransferase involved in cell wall biosynthesis
LLQAAKYVVKAKGREDVQFRIIGSGSELPRLKTMATEFSFNGNFEFVGRVDHDQVDEQLEVSDICVAPDPQNSFTDNCSMIKIFEYMAHGKPIVLFDLKEGRRSAGDAALYARPNDPEDFGEQIVKLLDSEALREKLGESGRRRVDETFNWEVQSARLVEAYRTVLEK